MAFKLGQAIIDKLRGKRKLKRPKDDIRVFGNPVLNQEAFFCGLGKITFGQNVNIGYFPSPYFSSTYAHIEARAETSEIFIDDNTYINNNACIISNGAKIQVGKNCRIGANFQCLDSDFHGLHPKDRDNPDAVLCRDVIIEDDVFIGNNVMILKGSFVGRGSVVGAGAVIAGKFGQMQVITGNPANTLKKIEE